MLHHIRVLLVLVVGPVGLDNPVDPIDRAGDPVARDEFRQVPKKSRKLGNGNPRITADAGREYTPVQEIYRHAKIVGHTGQTHYPVTL